MQLLCGPDDNKQLFELVIPENRSLAIMLSSGADSAILLYLICKELLDQGRDVGEIKYIFTVPKTDGAEHHSPNIVNAINNLLGISLPQPTIFGAQDVQTLHHSVQISESIRAVFSHYDSPETLGGLPLFLYLADQQVVPKPWIIEQGLYPPRITENPFPNNLAFPFLPFDKSHTIDLHFQFGTEILLELSHSCTALDAGRCGACYHCGERQWAFDRLGKADPGNN